MKLTIQSLGQVEGVHEDGSVDLGYPSTSDPARFVDREERVPVMVRLRAVQTRVNEGSGASLLARGAITATLC
jgi:hypothetical protein